MRVGNTRARFILLTLVCLLIASVAMAQEFWAKKPFNEWTSEELKKFMTDSPWAKNLAMTTGAPNAGLNMGAGGGGGGDEGGGGGGGGAGGGGGGGGARNAMTIVVSWQSALPIKQANVRSKMKNAGEVPADAQGYLAAADTAYVILIEGMSQAIARQALADAAKVKQSSLKAGKKEIVVADIKTRQSGRNMDILMFFDKKQPITVDDNEVEFDAKLGNFSFKKKFKLKEMVINGKLEL